MTGNNPKLHLVNVDIHSKFGVILSISSQDIERKRNYEVNQVPKLHETTKYIKGHNIVKILQKKVGNNPNVDLVNVDVHTKFGQILLIRSQYIETKQNLDVNQGP